MHTIGGMLLKEYLNKDNFLSVDEQWEATLEKGSTVVIDKINNELLKQPIKAIVGDH